MSVSTSTTRSDPTGLHRVLDRPLVLPQAAQRLDPDGVLWPDEVRVRVERLNLDAASFRQLAEKHTVAGHRDGEAVRDGGQTRILPVWPPPRTSPPRTRLSAASAR